jgi:nucleoside-diphosphate kinase
MGTLSSVEPCSCGTTTRQMTLSIIKPDAVSSHHIGEICSRFEKEGLTIVAAKVERLSRQRAELFYQAHKERPFFSSLTEYMSSGPVFVMVLEGDDAVAKNRQIMGATNPSLASSGTLRALYGKNVEKNAVHGSDSLKSAKEEISFFFTEGELESLR